MVFSNNESKLRNKLVENLTIMNPQNSSPLFPPINNDFLFLLEFTRRKCSLSVFAYAINSKGTHAKIKINI